MSRDALCCRNRSRCVTGEEGTGAGLTAKWEFGGGGGGKGKRREGGKREEGRGEDGGMHEAFRKPKECLGKEEEDGGVREESGGGSGNDGGDGCG